MHPSIGAANPMETAKTDSCGLSLTALPDMTAALTPRARMEDGPIGGQRSARGEGRLRSGLTSRRPVGRQRSLLEQSGPLFLPSVGSPPPSPALPTSTLRMGESLL